MRRLLTIDGGGIKGMFPAAFLARLESRLGRPVVDYFDLIAGTSTGGIIALALGLGYSAVDIAAFYRNYGEDIFPPGRSRFSLRGIFGAKYEAAPLKRVLQVVFGGHRLGESRKRLLIPSLNLDTGRIHVFKTAHHPKFGTDHRENMADVALATVSAPTYFPVHLRENGAHYIDGSLWARNPLGVAVVEAVGILEWDRSALHVLSLGCTSSDLDLRLGNEMSRGKTFWSARIPDVFMKAQSSAAIATAHALIGSSNLVRVSPLTTAGDFTLDGIGNIDRLEALGHGEADRLFDGLLDDFLVAPAASFHPDHTLDERDPASVAGSVAGQITS
jgi:patatin-like phospholipase/acyl hydrolase